MTNNYISNIEKEIVKYTESNSLDKVEKDAIQVLKMLMELFLSFINQKSRIDAQENFDDDFSKMKKKLIQFLEDKNYKPTEFKILKVRDFDDHSNHLSELMKNLCFYLNKYDFRVKYLNLYYYLFHLIYFMLYAIINSKEKMLLEDDYFKFYFFHIVHYFKEDKNTPESYYFFFHGAFKLLQKRYQIPTEFIIELNFDNLFTIPNTIKNIFKNYQKALLNKEKKASKEELDFIGNYSEYKNIISKIIEEKIDNIYETQPLNDNKRLKNLFTKVLECIDEIIKFLEKKCLVCLELNKYKKYIEDFIQLIDKHKLTKNNLILMEMNFQNKPMNDKYEFDYFDYDISKLIQYAKLCNQCEQDSEVDYTNTFKEIINSNKFQELYLSAMSSSHIKNFVIINNLDENYNFFMKNYAKNIHQYILYVPLTRGIKAYVTNYLRIALNINSIELFGEFDKESSHDFFAAYLLIQLLHESFHFIFRLNKSNVITTDENAKSPKSKKIKEYYEEIGVDLILYIFGTEYILFISKRNCELVCDPKSWENSQTNFKVFNKVYLSNLELIDEKDKEKSLDSGLKCNISLGYELIGNQDFKICTDSVIRYCF